MESRESGRERKKRKRKRQSKEKRDIKRVLRRECNLLTAVKGFKVDLEASRT